MTSVWLTAGLGVQDTSTIWSAETAAHVTAGLPAEDIPHSGYNLYVAPGDLAEVDFSMSPAVVIPAGQSSCVLLDYAFDVSQRYTLVLRSVISGYETPDFSCRFEFETDQEGQWLGVRPVSVEAVSAKQLSAGRVKLSWTYRTPDRGVSPEAFCVYYESGPGITAGDPQAVVSYEQDGAADCTLSLVGGQTYFFAVTARSSDGVESYLPPVVGPVLADSSAPLSPPVILTTTF